MSELKSKISLSSPHMGGKELAYIQETLDTNLMGLIGPNVDLFEKSISGLCSRKHCAALNSGTSALHMALIALGTGPGDYVICQSLNFAASANAITYLGATPVFIDSETDTWNMDPVQLERAIIELNEGRPGDRKQKGGYENRAQKIKAIIPVHIYGMPAKMNEIISIGKKYKIPVIENAAEALGSRYFKKPAGSMGAMSVLSFNNRMILTASGGGALLSDNNNLASKARKMATCSDDSGPEEMHAGYNYRMSQIIAGIGLSQLDVLNERVLRRRLINQFYRKNLANIPGIAFQTEPSSDFFSNYWLTAITVDPSLCRGVTREAIRHGMNDQNIEVTPLWKPLHLQPVFSDSPAFLNGNSENFFNKGLCLPSGSNLTENELNRVVETIFKSLRVRHARNEIFKNKAA
jgi:dTDP-4-amino-4,6-dideoxygalactose transaminase